MSGESTPVPHLRILLAIIIGLAAIIGLWLLGAVGLSTFLLH
jgi:hypothetical protein